MMHGMQLLLPASSDRPMRFVMRDIPLPSKSLPTVTAMTATGARQLRLLELSELEAFRTRDHGLLIFELERSDALDLLEWLGLGRREFGAIEPSELLALCRRRLWPEPRNYDPAKTSPRGTRPAGMLRAHTELLAAALTNITGTVLSFG